MEQQRHGLTLNVKQCSAAHWRRSRVCHSWTTQSHGVVSVWRLRRCWFKIFCNDHSINKMSLCWLKFPFYLKNLATHWSTLPTQNSYILDYCQLLPYIFLSMLVTSLFCLPMYILTNRHGADCLYVFLLSQIKKGPHHTCVNKQLVITCKNTYQFLLPCPPSQLSLLVICRPTRCALFYKYVNSLRLPFPYLCRNQVSPRQRHHWAFPPPPPEFWYRAPGRSTDKLISEG